MPKMTLYILLFIWILLEFYVFNAISNGMSNQYKTVGYIVNIIMILTTIITIVSVIMFYTKGLSKTIWWINMLMGLTVTFAVTKMCFIAVLSMGDVVRFISSIVTSVKDGAPQLNSRRNFVFNTALIVSAIPLGAFTWGVLKGRYNFKVFKNILSFPDLPDEFDGLKIVHISDIHSGSFDSYEAMKKGVDLIQQQNPDLILFTGDLVNNLSEEFVPYIDLFNNLKAKYGKFSTLGNHDYGMYVRWNSKEESLKNQKEIRDHHASMSFDLLNNENRTITKNGKSIKIVGVENWGRPPFPSRGDLNKALHGVNDNDFTILLSHDPHHWDDIVLKHNKKIHLTLSGHTHGMQMGVDIPGFKWSPIKLRYKRWAGLYEEFSQYLYVNRGFGHLGFPGRVGIMPEITVLELKKAFTKIS